MIYKSIKIEQFNLLAFFSTVFLIILYLFMANNMVMANYRKTILLKNIDSLRTEIRTLNLELVDKRSIGFLKKAAQNLNLVVNKDIQYVKITGSVAKNP